MTATIRPAHPDDAETVLRFIYELAEYERLRHEARITLEDVRRILFPQPPTAARAFCDIAESAQGPVGFALWFYSVSTFEGRHGIWLEDLYVQPEARGVGAGKALLANLARRCRDENLARLEWSVLNWNASAIGFYDSLGAGAQTEWTTRRLTGKALADLAG